MTDDLLDSVAQAVARAPREDRFRWVYEATVEHRRRHRCGAYPFADGALLGAIGEAIGPRSVLELGTALGYTACCWAAAGGSVDTIEGDGVHVQLARRNVVQAGLDSCIQVHEGEFADVLGRLGAEYDVGFFDGFAPTMETLDDLALHLADRGILVVTNLNLAGPDVLDTLLARSIWRTRLIGSDLLIAMRR